MATSRDLYLATSGDFFMATDRAGRMSDDRRPAVAECWTGRSFSGNASHGVDCLSQGVQRVVGAGLDGARRHAKGRGGLGHRCAAEVTLEQHLPMLGRQRPQRAGTSAGRRFAASCPRPAAREPGRWPPRSASRCPPFVDDDALGHGEQPPTPGAAALVQPRKVAPGAKQGLLHNVLGLAVVSTGQADNVGPQGMRVLIVQRAQLVGLTRPTRAAVMPRARGLRAPARPVGRRGRPPGRLEAAATPQPGRLSARAASPTQMPPGRPPIRRSWPGSRT